MSAAVQNLPEYLRKYISVQRYENYTAEDHAAWRYIMRQSRQYFREHAVESYLEGLEKTGIPTDRIPRITEMDEALNRFGWGAVPVVGFIPPSAFLDFQSRKVLPIAADMRTVEHIAYTPAPDIVHEAAGHAPVLADPEYAEYLCRYATLAQKAIMSLEDIRLYEAIRNLSDVKENPDCTPSQIKKAEAALEEANRNISFVSEAAKVARMNWWTVEYGLAGDITNPRIYGAGLLSSVGESQNCLSDTVKKIPLTVDCVEYSYDITEPQPQLFVTPNMKHLTVVLEHLEDRMAFKIGGKVGLERAVEARTVTTAVLDSGIAASGVCKTFEVDSRDNPSFIAFEGPVQLCMNEKQLEGHGRERHPHGFSSPIGKWRGLDKAPTEANDSDLTRLGLVPNKRATLVFESGFEVSGTLKSSLRLQGKLLCLTWADCTVKRGTKIYFEPSWGEFDMLVGNQVVSVHGGPADRVQYGEYEVGLATSSPSRTSPHSESEKKRFEMYQRVRAYRDGGKSDPKALQALLDQAKIFADDWLIQLELLEIAEELPDAARSQLSGIDALRANLESSGNKTKKWLIERGLDLITKA
ncbi:MAG: aromatic amino acid hydroxylase [Bdellovibrionaceae bacterium]|nr:aromatic amino acid hydroxylase [Bdellovibrionales bacterium]MCB9254681.1 aromatic amino acid hydroxylase [Pseudobdellovibrionaceae bacterium]